jgi:hypothetical protein
MRGGDGNHESRSPYLPTGYRLDEDADFLVLRREDGSEVAAFSVKMRTSQDSYPTPRPSFMPWVSGKTLARRSALG